MFVFFVTFLSIMQSFMHSAKPPLPLRYARLHGAMRPKNCLNCDIFIPHHNRSEPKRIVCVFKIFEKKLGFALTEYRICVYNSIREE